MQSQIKPVLIQAGQQYSEKLLNKGLRFEIIEDKDVQHTPYKLSIWGKNNRERWEIKRRGDRDVPDPDTGKRSGKVRNLRWKLYKESKLELDMENMNPEDLLQHILDNLPDRTHNRPLY